MYSFLHVASEYKVYQRDWRQCVILSDVTIFFILCQTTVQYQGKNRQLIKSWKNQHGNRLAVSHYQ